KSTLLNLIANKLGMPGSERMTSSGFSEYVQRFLDFSRYQLGNEDEEDEIRQLPEGSRYIKSEDILYEIKKIQQEAALREGILFEKRKEGMTQEQVMQYEKSYDFREKVDIIQF